MIPGIANSLLLQSPALVRFLNLAVVGIAAAPTGAEFTSISASGTVTANNNRYLFAVGYGTPTAVTINRQTVAFVQSGPLFYAFLAAPTDTSVSATATLSGQIAGISLFTVECYGTLTSANLTSAVTTASRPASGFLMAFAMASSTQSHGSDGFVGFTSTSNGTNYAAAEGSPIDTSGGAISMTPSISPGTNYIVVVS